MNVVLEVKVLPKGDHPERSELQLRKGDLSWGGGPVPLDVEFGEGAFLAAR
jgi:hypothetical protein